MIIFRVLRGVGARFLVEQFEDLILGARRFRLGFGSGFECDSPGKQSLNRFHLDVHAVGTHAEREARRIPKSRSGVHEFVVRIAHENSDGDVAFAVADVVTEHLADRHVAKKNGSAGAE